MREIKFRAWDKENKKFYDDIFGIDDSGQVILIEQGAVWTTPKYVVAKNCIPLQYTGIKDKNEKEIYEGDILKGISEHTEIDGTPRTAISVGAVKFYENLCCFMVDRLNAEPEELVDWIQESVYVIGNIYENPELMKEGKE